MDYSEFLENFEVFLTDKKLPKAKIDIILKLFQGLSPTEISQQHGVSIYTTRVHITDLLKKLKTEQGLDTQTRKSLHWGVVTLLKEFTEKSAFIKIR